jgi:hypothetical protein
MMSSRSNCVRSLRGYVCLLAVLAIYAPQSMLAWWTGTGACCTRDYCPIHAHHQQSNTAKQEQDGMHCEHGAPGMAACTMSCCHDTQQAPMSPVAFVLERSVQLEGLSNVAQISDPGTVQSILQSSKPVSPPPRFVAAA